ncbi:hypothetical protein HCJ76_14320 [Streptomyces sp. MC1]|uniref:hypothetical protein n=1 Tax=Streptomyces TaxID=1883 RepID=UPI0018CAF996|nr:hypothetical protein [Streptomyces sp. MC1]MBG7699224.1 hypothetical protein [Streptomyces sp. MC1]
MAQATGAARDIEVTAQSLHEDLARLRLQKQALERELAAVMAHLDTVQRALGALQVLMADPASGSSAPADTVEAGRRRAPEPRRAHTDTPPAGPPAVAEVSRASRQPKKRRGPDKRASRPETEGKRTYGELTEQILEYFSQAGDADVRARDVAAALGRDTDNGSINAVRSTLDRLVGASRVRRTGRGLYRAQRS